MDIQAAVKRMRQADLKEFNILNLGQIIEKLKEQDQKETIMFDFGGYVPDMELDSYRGSYDELCVGYKKQEWNKDQTVGDFLKACEKAVGNTYTGYKGGDFTMDEDTPVWVAQYSEATSTGIVDIRYCSHFVLIETKHCEE